MNYGVIRSFALTWQKGLPLYRLLILQAGGEWIYLYIYVSNYRLRKDDIVSWDTDALYWHADDRDVKFDLVGGTVVRNP